MIKAKLIPVVIAFWLFFFSLAAFAHQPVTVGDLLDKGGMKLTKDEFTKVLTGATVTGNVPSNPGREAEMNYSKDGAATGRSTGGSGVGIAYGLFGTWLINDQAQLCLSLRNTFNSDVSPPCQFYFILGNTYYAATSDDNTARVFVREIKR